MKLYSLPENSRFSNKELFAFLIPLIFEQFILGCLSMVDTVMVSSLGETAVAGVSLVSRIDLFVKQFITALAQGGCVVLAQYIGARNMEKSKKSLKNNIVIVFAIGFLFMAVMVVFREQILNLLFGKAEKEVLALSSQYFSVTALSYPATALYYACTSTYRTMGKSRVTLYGSVAMMSINIMLKYIFLFVFKIGIIGAGLSTFIAMLLMGIVLLIGLTSEKNSVPLENIFKPELDLKMSTRILKISIPNGIEQGMFQLGALLIASLVSGLGTAAIAGDQIARTVSVFVVAPGAGFIALAMMVIGQCMGAGDIDEAKMYKKHMIKLQYVVLAVFAIVSLVFLKPIVSIFDVSDEAKLIARQILTLYGVGAMLLYTPSFTIPACLRATGDTKFVMFISGASMLVFRVAAAYLFVNVFKMGIIGTWVAMISDWVIRSIIFHFRFRNEKWQKNKVI